MDGVSTVGLAKVGNGGSTLNADAIVNIGTSQTLAALNIGAGAVVTLDSTLPSPAPAFGDPLLGTEASVAAARPVEIGRASCRERV